MMRSAILIALMLVASAQGAFACSEQPLGMTANGGVFIPVENGASRILNSMHNAVFFEDNGAWGLEGDMLRNVTLSLGDIVPVERCASGKPDVFLGDMKKFDAEQFKHNVGWVRRNLDKFFNSRETGPLDSMSAAVARDLMFDPAIAKKLASKGLVVDFARGVIRRKQNTVTQEIGEGEVVRVTTDEIAFLPPTSERALMAIYLEMDSDGRLLITWDYHGDDTLAVARTEKRFYELKDGAIGKGWLYFKEGDSVAGASQIKQIR